ncbi:MAG: 3D domain-containing protein [Phycisphaerales bacterium]|nr:3D domain-containing protein [Phycisphaerales bacterium]
MSYRARTLDGPLLHVLGLSVCVIVVLTMVTFLVASPPPPLLTTVDAVPVESGAATSAAAHRAAEAERVRDAAFDASVVNNGVSAELALDSAEEFAPAAVVVEGWFNGRPLVRAGTMMMTVTAYSPDERSCGADADGITASGYSVWTNGMRSVAADTRLLPFGTLLSVPGYHDGGVVPVLDRGGRIKGHRLDVLYPTHARARAWGVREVEVTIWRYADGQPDDFRQQH